MRTLCFYAVGGLWTVLVLVAGLVVGLFPGGQRGLFFIARRLWSPVYLWSAGARLVVVRGGEALDPDEPFVFVANHGSYLDIPALFLALPRFDVRFVAKRELMWVPLLNFYLWRLGCPIVDRGNHARAVRTMARAGRKIREGTPVFVFAEGTRTSTGALRPFKKGAAVLALEAGVRPVPVAIHGSYPILNKVRFAVRPGTLRVAVGDPLDVSALTLADRDALTALLRARVEERYAALEALAAVSE
jgi:1-acyl-sn-glycerol-3-phosphate acyltransferase